MNGSPSFYRAAISLLGLILVGACSTGRPGIAIVNLETGRQIVRTLPGGFNEEPIDVDESTGVFRTLQRSETNSLVLRTVDFHGNTLLEKELPIFDDTLSGYGATWAYAVTPDGSGVAYLDGQSRELRLFDFGKRAYGVLATNVTSSAVHIAFMYWLPDGCLLVGAHEPEQNGQDVILLIDPVRGDVTPIARPRALDRGKNALSFSKRQLVFWEGSERSSMQGQFVVFDLASRSPAATVQSLSGDWLFRPCWSLDERRVAYTEGARQVVFYSMVDRSSFLAVQAATNQTACLYAFGKRQVIYKVYDTKKNDVLEVPLRIRDVLDGSERQIRGVRINGPAFLLNNGTKLIAKVGF